MYDNIRQCKTIQYNTSSDKTRPDKTSQDNTRHRMQYQTIYDNTREIQYNIRQDKTRQYKAI